MLNKINRLAKSALLKDSVIYVLGEMTTKAVPFLLLPYLTRVLGASGFGELSYFMAISSFLLIFISLSQNATLTRYYYVYGKRGLGNVLLAGSLYSFAVFLLGLVICIWLHSEALFYSVLIAFLQSLVQNQLSLRQCQKRAVSYFGIQLALALTNISFTLGLFYLLQNNPVIERLMAISLSYLFTFIGAFVLAKRQFGLSFSLSKQRLTLSMRYILAMGLPLILHTLSYTVKGQFDRVLINQRFSAQELGVYSAGVQVASVVTIVIMAVNSASVPYLYERLKSGKIKLPQLHRLFWLSFTIPPVLTLVVYLLPMSLFTWVLGQDFADSRYYTVCFVLAFSLTIPYLILVNFLFYHARNAQISTASIISTVIYVICLFIFSQLSLSFIPLATVISSCTILPMLYYFTVRANNNELV